MEKEKETKHIQGKEELPYNRWWEPDFDSTTNFSLLGWFWGRLEYRLDSRKKVNLILDDS
jgi:hypothetical protein